jgi:hypothetical protein
MQRGNHPLSTSLFEAASNAVPESKALLMLNESISDALMLSAQAIGQSLCSANIADGTTQPLLDAFPALPTFDPILGAHVANAILPIIKGVAGN